MVTTERSESSYGQPVFVVDGELVEEVEGLVVLVLLLGGAAKIRKMVEDFENEV